MKLTNIDITLYDLNGILYENKQYTKHIFKLYKKYIYEYFCKNRKRLTIVDKLVYRTYILNNNILLIKKCTSINVDVKAIVVCESFNDETIYITNIIRIDSTPISAIVDFVITNTTSLFKNYKRVIVNLKCSNDSDMISKLRHSGYEISNISAGIEI